MSLSFFSLVFLEISKRCLRGGLISILLAIGSFFSAWLSCLFDLSPLYSSFDTSSLGLSIAVSSFTSPSNFSFDSFLVASWLIFAATSSPAAVSSWISASPPHSPPSWWAFCFPFILLLFSPSTLFGGILSGTGGLFLI